MAYVEEALKNTQDNTERKNQQEIVAQMKAGLARVAAEEQRLQAIEIDAATQLRMEQAKLADLQDQLERLDKLLDSLTRK
jgi:stress response protein SCP2